MAERLLLVGIGASVGGVARYLVGLYITERYGQSFPYGTLTVNVLGSFILALVLAATGERFALGMEWRLLFGTGFCGGFTTFSTFAYESLVLARGAALVPAAVNVAANVVLSVVAVVAGLWSGQRLAGG